MNAYEHGFNVAFALWVFGDYEKMITHSGPLLRKFGLRAKALTVTRHDRYVNNRDPQTGEQLR